MKEIVLRRKDLMEIHFEPGDYTHYHFYLALESNEGYVIFPGQRSTFIFPQRMDIYDAEHIVESCNDKGTDMCRKCIEIAEKYNCNPHTVLSVAKIINENENN